MKAIVFDEHGPIDVLDYREIEEPTLQPGEVRVAVRACSLNYHDVFTRQGMPGIILWASLCISLTYPKEYSRLTWATAWLPQS